MSDSFKALEKQLDTWCYNRYTPYMYHSREISLNFIIICTSVDALTITAAERTTVESPEPYGIVSATIATLVHLPMLLLPLLLPSLVRAATKQVLSKVC
jgi:hypothetical protein